MAGRSVLGMCAVLVAFGIHGHASAQDAAEEAAIMSGSGPAQAQAARSLGSAIGQSIGSASNAVYAATHPGGPQASGAQAQSGRASPSWAAAPQFSYVIPGYLDALSRMNAPTYRLGNGRTIKVSGMMFFAPPTMCIRNCKAGQAY